MQFCVNVFLLQKILWGRFYKGKYPTVILQVYKYHLYLSNIQKHVCCGQYLGRPHIGDFTQGGNDCYWIGEFLVCSEAYKVVDLFAKFLYFCVCVIFLAVRSSSILFTRFTCWTCLKWSLNLAINENYVFWGTFERSLL